MKLTLYVNPEDKAALKALAERLGMIDSKHGAGSVSALVRALARMQRERPDLAEVLGWEIAKFGESG